jgi:hypothetical protein
MFSNLQGGIFSDNAAPYDYSAALGIVLLLIVDYLGMAAGKLPHSVIRELHSLSTCTADSPIGRRDFGPSRTRDS